MRCSLTGVKPEEEMGMLKKTNPIFIRGLKEYMRMNTAAQKWNAEDRILRHTNNSIFDKPAYKIYTIKYHGSKPERKIIFQIKYEPIWIKELSYRVHSVRMLPVYNSFKSKKAYEMYAKWLKEHNTEPRIHPLTVNTAVVLEEVIYSGNQIKEIKTFSTFDDLAGAAVKEDRQHQFMQERM